MATKNADEQETILLSGATVTGAGGHFTVNRGAKNRVFAAEVAGTGAVGATIKIWGRAGPLVNGVLLGTITLSGTTTATDGFASDGPWPEVWAEVTAISGTGAAATVAMGI